MRASNDLVHSHCEDSHTHTPSPSHTIELSFYGKSTECVTYKCFNTKRGNACTFLDFLLIKVHRRVARTTYSLYPSLVRSDAEKGETPPFSFLATPKEFVHVWLPRDFDRG
jgi:hypothetical protein